MLKLKLRYFGHLMRRTDSLEKALILGKIEGRRRRGDRGQDGWLASLTEWTWVWKSSRSWWWTGKPVMLQSMGSQRVGHGWTDWSLTIWESPRSISHRHKRKKDGISLKNGEICFQTALRVHLQHLQLAVLPCRFSTYQPPQSLS